MYYINFECQNRCFIPVGSARTEAPIPLLLEGVAESRGSNIGDHGVAVPFSISNP